MHLHSLSQSANCSFLEENSVECTLLSPYCCDTNEQRCGKKNCGMRVCSEFPSQVSSNSYDYCCGNGLCQRSYTALLKTWIFLALACTPLIVLIPEQSSVFLLFQELVVGPTNA